ncbi:MAG: PilZ domain-containing protein [Candidatus Eremiobacteraeota bacterium]|nr:PilZ domain-containing protein [Candidatus Eremiobacteraeota bacterium]
MSWIPQKHNGARNCALVDVPGKSFAHSLEMPVVMRVKRLPAAVYGTLMKITAATAQIRSLVLIDRGTEVQLDLEIPNSAPLAICGHIHERRTAISGARFEYHVRFDATPDAQLDALAKYVRELERRTASAKSIQAKIDALPSSDKNRRSSYRAMAEFSVAFRADTDTSFHEGIVADISGTGIRMISAFTIPIGTALELRLVLPSHVLAVYPEETVAIDTCEAAKRGGRPDMRRPFDAMALRSRVVTRFRPSGDRQVYGVAFVEIDGFQREEIARFTHAVQLARIRRFC